MDSNHRSKKQQIYSLPPLATRELSHINGINRYLDFYNQTSAFRLTEMKIKMELVDGLEPPTC